MTHLNVLRFPAEATRPTKKTAKPARKKVTDFPLWVHQGKQLWTRKIKGKFHYFGRVESDPNGDAALKLWLEQRDDLLAGRVPRAKVGIKLSDVCNQFLTAKRRAVDSGKLSARTFVEYDRTCQLLIKTYGRDRLAEDLGPADFSKLYGDLVKSFGLTTIGREVIKVRTLFNFAIESDLITKAIKYGPEFVTPSKTDRRKHKANLKHANGAKLFTADEIRRMLDAAGPQLKCMLLLAANGGFGNTDCATLPLSALDLKKGWLDHPRPKTGIDRRVPLWPETVKALKAVIAKRQLPRSPEHANLVFLTRLGQPWVRYELAETQEDDGKVKVVGKADDAIAKATTKLLTNLGIKRPGLSFYAIRHTFETEAGASRDQVAVDAIMGHVDPSMAAEYRERIDDVRLQNVVQHVRTWLFRKSVKRLKGKAVQHA